MIAQNRRLHCPRCSGTTLFTATGYYNDGSLRLVCAGCESNGGALHQCPHDGLFALPRWLPLLVAGIGVVCPQCKAAYDIGIKIEPTYPDAGQALQAAGLILGTVILVGAIIEALNRGKGRR